MKHDSFFQRAILFLFHLLVITVPFFFTWVNNELFEFNKMLLTYGITTIILGLWTCRMIVQKKFLWKKTWFDIPILLFVISQLISTLFSIHPRTSWLGYYSRFHGGFLSTLTYVGLFYAFIHNISKKQVKGFLFSVLVAALGVTLYTIPEHFGVSPSCIIISGEANTSCWVQDVQSRVFGTFGQPNWLAAYVITLLPLSFVVTIQQFKEKHKKLTVFASITTLFLFVTLLFTASRSGFLGFAISLLLLIVGVGTALVYQKKSKAKIQKQTLSISIGLVGVIALTALLFGTPFSPSFADILNTIKPPTQPKVPQENLIEETPQPVTNRLEVGGTDSGEIRKIVWQGTVDIWKRYPIFGSGVETFAYSYYLDRPVEHNLVSEWDFLYNKAHNEFLNYLATTGIIGLFTYLLALSFLAFKPVHHAFTTKTDASAKLLAVGIASGITALSVSNFFGFSTVMVTILMFLLPASYWVLVSKEKSEDNTKEVSLIQLLGFGIVTVVVTIGLSQISTWWRADVAYNTGKQLADAGQLSQGAELARQAVELSPNEALFHDELGQTYAQIAATLDQQNEATAAAIYTSAAETASAATFELNPVHLNFYKTQARLYIVLGNIDPNYFATALNILRKGREIAPTDAKIWYNIALIEDSLGDRNQAIQTLHETIALRPNYEQARMALAEAYEQEGSYQAALEQYQTVLESIAPGNTIAARKLELLEASISAQQNK